MTIGMLLIAAWLGEAAASPESVDAGLAPLVVEYLYAETPERVPSTLVVGMPGGTVRRIAVGEVTEVVYTAEDAVDSIDLVTAAGTLRVMSGSLQYSHASRIASWSGVQVRSVGASPGRGLIAVKTAGIEPDPSAPQGSPVWYHPVIIGKIDRQLVKEALWKKGRTSRTARRRRPAAGRAAASSR